MKHNNFLTIRKSFIMCLIEKMVLVEILQNWEWRLGSEWKDHSRIFCSVKKGIKLAADRYWFSDTKAAQDTLILRQKYP